MEKNTKAKGKVPTPVSKKLALKASPKVTKVNSLKLASNHNETLL